MTTIQANQIGKGGYEFIPHVYRMDILTNMLSNIHLTGKELFNLILKEGKELCNERRQGWLFESLCQIVIMLKCVQNLNYTGITDGQLQNLKNVKNVNNLLKVKVEGAGNNIVDMSFKQDTTTILVSVKYKNKFDDGDLVDIHANIQGITQDYKKIYIVKDKQVIIKHSFNNTKDERCVEIKKVINGDNLLFDEQDIIKALDVFCKRFSSNTLNTKEFIDFINEKYLQCPRKQLVKRLHQQMTELKFIESLSTKKYKKWCVAHKMRSGKSITILSICKVLLESGQRRILIMTSVPATIDSFIKDLDEYIDFKNINYKTQNMFDSIDESDTGLFFCSVQYLKTDNTNKKKPMLKKMNFNTIITDEAHQGGSTDKTKKEILEVNSDVENIRKSIPLSIFVSGTADKTRKFYNIPKSCVYEWETEDECYMKELQKKNITVTEKEEILSYMSYRHGPMFKKCYEDKTLDMDYSKMPIQVLMKHKLHQSVIDDIKKYNFEHNTNYGYSCSSLFALRQSVNDKGEKIFMEEFELCKDTDGKEILLGFFDNIISKDRNRQDTIMKQIEHTQTSYISRKSCVKDPKLFIIYLPTHTGNNTIAKLQKTMKSFLKDNDLWTDYNIEYSNSIEDTGDIKENYNSYIETIMATTKKGKNRGCILLLGNKGSVGITYKECDVTVSLDDGHNLDNQSQRLLRAGTDAPGKTVAINIDMNIQRSYLYVMNIIQKHQKNTKTEKTNAEILYYLYEHNIFLFDPQEINNGDLTSHEIMSYYKKESKNIMKNIDDTLLLEYIVCIIRPSIFWVKRMCNKKKT